MFSSIYWNVPIRSYHFLDSMIVDYSLWKSLSCDYKFQIAIYDNEFIVYNKETLSIVDNISSHNDKTLDKARSEIKSASEFFDITVPLHKIMAVYPPINETVKNSIYMEYMSNVKV